MSDEGANGSCKTDCLIFSAISPEGRGLNLGELLFKKDGNSKLKTIFGAFLIREAEPYFAVRQPMNS
jgi:hypothetical protein